MSLQLKAKNKYEKEEFIAQSEKEFSACPRMVRKHNNCFQNVTPMLDVIIIRKY